MMSEETINESKMKFNTKTTTNGVQNKKEITKSGEITVREDVSQ